MSNVELFDKAGAAIAASSKEVKTVVKLTTEEVQLSQQLTELEEAAKQIKSRLHILRTKELPDAMAAMGSSNWTNSSGKVTVKIDDFVAGSLPKDPEARAEAIKWLEQHDGSGMIRNEINVEFDREEHAAAKKIFDQLSKKGWQPVMTSGVHPQTLLAYARERQRNGEDIDFDKLGLFAGRMAKVVINEKKEKGNKK